MNRRERRPGPAAEDGQALVLLVGLVVLVLMVLALGWDTSNWFLGHRALANLADGAAVAAAGEVDVAAWYASGGREVRVVEGRARATVGAYLEGSAGDSGVAGVRLRSVSVAPGAWRAGGDGGGGGAGAGGVAAAAGGGAAADGGSGGGDGAAAGAVRRGIDTGAGPASSGHTSRQSPTGGAPGVQVAIARPA